MSRKSFPSQQIGDFTVTAISDGYLTASLDFLSNIDPQEAGCIQAAAGVIPQTSVHINCYLVRGGGHTILIDSGAGGFKQWGGNLLVHLSLAGVEPAEIDRILLTHAHPDHIGGLITSSGIPAFPNAELLVHEQEAIFWQDDGNLSRADERARGNFHLARLVFDSYRSKLRRFGCGEILQAIHAMPIPGHTLGHTAFRIESGGRSVLIWGDIVHFPHIQISRPEVSIAFDQDPFMAAQTRLKILDLVHMEKLLIGGMHLGKSGFARIEKTNGSYGLVYAP